MQCDTNVIDWEYVWWNGETCEDTLHLEEPRSVCRFGSGDMWKSGPAWPKRAKRCETKRPARLSSSAAYQATFADLLRRAAYATKRGERRA